MLHKLLNACLFAAFLFPHSVFAQLAWEPLNGPPGLSLQRNLVRGTDRILMTIPSKGLVMASTDNGISWFSARGSLQSYQIGQFLKDSSGSVYLVSAANKSICKYNNSANDWEQMSSAIDGVANENTLGVTREGFFCVTSYATTSPPTTQIHVSTDGGQTFVTPPLSGTSIDGWWRRYASYSFEHNLIATNDGNQYKLYHFSLDGTVQLASLQSQSEYSFLGFNEKTGTAFASNASHKFRSADGGITWDTIVPVIGFIQGLQTDENNRLWATTSFQRLYYSDDDGINWTYYPLSYSFDDHLYLGNQNWLGSSSCNLRLVTDNGTTVTEVSEQFNRGKVYKFFKANNGDLYAQLCGLGYRRSSDNGWTWQQIVIDDDGTPRPVSSVYVNTQGILLAFSSGSSGYFRSADSGLTWEKIVSPIASYPGNLYPDGYGNFYIHSGNVHFKSTDGGFTFQPIQVQGLQSPYEPLHAANGDLFFPRRAPNTTFTEGMFRWNNAAQTLDSLAIGGNNTYDPSLYRYSADGIVYFRVSASYEVPAGLYKVMPGATEPVKTNGPLPFPPPSFADMFINREGHLFILNNVEGIYKSEDQGETWTYVGNYPTAQLTKAYQSDDGYLYLAYNGEVMKRSALTFNSVNIISGKTWLDGNLDCSYQTGESLMAFAPVQAMGEINYGNYADQNGDFRIAVGAGSYQVKVTNGNPLMEICQSIPEVDIQMPGQSAIADLPYTGTAQCPLLSVGMTTPRMRRCFNNTYHVFYRNQGTATAPAAAVKITLDPYLIFQSSSVPAVSSPGNVYTFEVGDLAPGQSGSFLITVKVSCSAELGQLHCIEASMLPVSDCPVSLPESRYSECRHNTGSYDPNEKLAFVDGMPADGGVEAGKEIEFLINFQNTGTDTAFTVVVEDPISPNLDLMSVVPTASSHPFRMDIKEGRILRFTFDNIMLPDSNVNEPLSHGFVKFRISQKPDATAGLDIFNRAGIYFDFNPPVLTNEVHLFTTLSSTRMPMPGYTVTAYPNPFHDNLYLEVACRNCSQEEKQVYVVDLLGRMILSESFSGTGHSVSTAAWQSGVYFYLVMQHGKVIGRGKLVKG